MRKSNTIHAIACLIVSAVLAGACGSSSNPVAPSSSTVVRRVVVLGDSLSVTPTPAESFPAALQSRMTGGRLPWTVSNAGVYGDTTADGLRRYEPLLQGDVGVLILELGANDGIGGVDATTIERNLATVIEVAQAHGIAVILCGMETPPLRGVGYTVAFHDVFPRLSRRYNIPLVPFLLTGVALVPEMNGPDGVHPNAAGARRIAENVWPYLEPLLRSGPT
jgi:acyl-CoA thioesterase I